MTDPENTTPAPVLLPPVADVATPPVVEEKKMGRPVDYGPEMLKKAQEYLESCIDEEEEVLSAVTKQGMELYKRKLHVKLPSKGGLAVALRVARSTLYEWAETYPDFSDIMEQLSSIQEERLINKGTSGEYNPTIAKVLLTKHGYREGRELTGENGTPLLPVDATTKEKADKAVASFLKHGGAEKNTG